MIDRLSSTSTTKLFTCIYSSYSFRNCSPSSARLRHVYWLRYDMHHFPYLPILPSPEISSLSHIFFQSLIGRVENIVETQIEKEGRKLCVTFLSNFKYIIILQRKGTGSLPRLFSSTITQWQLLLGIRLHASCDKSYNLYLYFTRVQ